MDQERAKAFRRIAPKEDRKKYFSRREERVRQSDIATAAKGSQPNRG